MKVVKMGNIAPRVGIESTSALHPSPVCQPLHCLDVTTLSMPTCLYGSLPERSVQTTTIAIAVIIAGKVMKLAKHYVRKLQAIVSGRP